MPNDDPFTAAAHPLSRASERPILFDVSRLIWRVWSRRLPTGIDRVCLAYLDHYGYRARAVVQRGGLRFVLNGKQSDRLFSVLRSRRDGSRRRLVRILAAALPAALMAKVRPGAVYLNVGHTGLNEASLPQWIANNRLRAIYMVHDLIPLTHPEFCRAGEATRHESRVVNMLASAHGVIGNSHASLAELTAFAGTRGLQLPPTVAAWISGPPLQGAAGEPPLSTPYFVTLGTIEGRKNHLLLLDIWRELVRTMGETAPTLLVIGQRGWAAERALALLDRPEAFDGKVIELNHCTDGELAVWLGGARALLMPSFAEGFGLPIIEALGLGCPVIASDLPVFREIGDMIPTFVDPRDRDGWAQQVRNFMGENPRRSAQVARMEHYRPPGWRQHFAIVDEWLDSL